MKPVRLRYQTIDFRDFDIHVRTLRDKMQYDDLEETALKFGISSATWPLFGVIWESGSILAHIMSEYDIEGQRILEVGCGIGLASLVINHRGADITATDYHPEAETFLLKNTLLNEDPQITFVRTSWNDRVNHALGLFSLIIGSDLLYENEHAKNLASFINQHAETRCTVLIVDPGRGQVAKFKRFMGEFGFSLSPGERLSIAKEHNQFKGKVLLFGR